MTTVISPALADAGLPLQAAVPVARLTDDVRHALVATDVDPDGFATMLLFGQGGRRLFEQHVAGELDRTDPFDTISTQLVEEWLAETHPDVRFEVVYPGSAPLPLGRLAELIGWGRPSPLGLSINAEFGLWIAHRVVVLVEADIVVSGQAAATHPCDSCADTPCVTACPVGAVTLTDPFDLERCSRHRIALDSVCAYQCLARNACPVGADHRYGPVQMRHHYGAGLASIRRWLEPDGGPDPESGVDSKG